MNYQFDMTSVLPNNPFPRPPDLPAPKPGDLPDYPVPKPGDLPDYPVPKPGDLPDYPVPPGPQHAPPPYHISEPPALPPTVAPLEPIPMP